MEKIKTAIIGYGGMGGWHADRLLESERFELAGVYDIKETQLQRAREKGIFTYASREALLADESIELVTIATYNDVHKEIAIAAMQAGKNVVCEKPVAMSSDELKEMIAVANETGKLFTVHQNRRWDSDFLTVRNLIDKNTLGKIFRIESRVHGSRGIPGDWRREKKHGGGMVLDWGVHLLDQALYMNEGNPPVSVWAKTTSVTNDECDDGFYAELLFADGLSFLVEVCTNNFISLPLWYVLGENGTTLIEDWDCNGKTVLVHNWENIDAVPIQAGSGITKTMAPRTDETIKEIPIEKVEGSWTEYYDNIYEVLKGRASPIVTHRQMLSCFELIEAVFKSAETNSVVYM